jgi:uncharacterized Fe-S center protein
MALTKNAAYDNAIYLAVVQAPLGTLSGAAGVTQRFVAITTTLLKSVNIKCVTAGTVADAKTLLINSGSSTSTTVLCTHTAFAGTGTNVTTTQTLSAGDAAWVLKGADATEVSGVGFELVILPGASVTP